MSVLNAGHILFIPQPAKRVNIFFIHLVHGSISWEEKPSHFCSLFHAYLQVLERAFFQTVTHILNKE